ncbi:hypothetical protein N7495_003223 [Penicillium taxi]|uniref:uncharacterized protein n=1 Tax=Penicillium taxi TaxID=168475 RepID=UPI00254539BB|nr:uncharacterized protein N7495_003223 [Penicillium taxi]KAJ5902695.1 hypothetical protein N7495_003223 [Penicillium taxi]
MVYCGKPSKGCGHCRSKKVRCDGARPSCSQCIRAKRSCPGYRDQLSLMFRDESRSVAQKVEKAAKSSSLLSKSWSPRGSPRTAYSDGSTPSELSVSADSPIFDFDSDPLHVYLMQQLSQLPLEVQTPFDPSDHEAISYFMQSNAIPGTIWVTDFMTKLALSNDGFGSLSQRALKSGLTAVGSAMLCRVKNVSALNAVSQKAYISALSLLNTALTDIEEAKSNQVLGAVVILAIYELVTSRTPKDIDQWTNHILGATALLDLRGTDQLSTETGLRLFLHLRYQIVISCIQRDARVPESVLECAKVSMYLRPDEAHANSLIIIIGKISNLRADIKSNILTSNNDILSVASAIEMDLISWLRLLPPTYDYETRTKSAYDFKFQQRCHGIALYDDKYHVYPNLWVSNSWSQYRCARIILSELILTRTLEQAKSSSSKSLSPELRLYCNSLHSTVRRLAVDICRSLPFHFRAHDDGSDGSHNTTLPPPEGYLGGLLLLWPLFLAGAVEKNGHALHTWVIRSLLIIGNTMGLDQALALMDILGYDPSFPQEVSEAEEMELTPSVGEVEEEGVRISGNLSSFMSFKD